MPIYLPGAFTFPRSLRLGGWWLLLGWAVALAVVLWRFALPAVVPTGADPVDFSAERALAHLPPLTAAPRPVGSAGHARTQAYLLDELRELGLEPQLQSTTSLLRFSGAPTFSGGHVENIIVRLPGRDPSGAIAINAHYDGATNGPAAADCGACVVTVLETIRTLPAGPPLRNDLIFVFADAEEVGDLGAHAFATQHPWMRDVRLALNYEAMGTAGPAFLYATHANNLDAMRAYAAAGIASPTNSFTVGIFNLLPAQRLACDLQDYLDAGSAGYGFVFTGNITPYHTRLDDIEHLSPRTVQQLGRTTLGLLRYWGDADLNAIESTEEAVFFALWPGRLVVYPAGWSMPPAVGGALFLGLVLLWLLRRRRLAAGPVLAASSVFLLGGLLLVGLSVLSWQAIKSAQPELSDFLVGHWGVYEYLAGLMVATAALSLLVARWSGRWLSPRARLAGALVGYAVIGLLLGHYYPLGNYVFAWPVWIGAPVLALVCSDRATPFQRRLAALALGVAVILLNAPLLIGSNPLMALLIRLDATTPLPALGLAPVVMVFGWLLLISLFDSVGDGESARPRWSLILGTGGIALALLGGAVWQTDYTAERPRPESIRYELDANRGTAQWVSGDAYLGEWTSQFIPPAQTLEPPSTLLRYWPVTFAAPAPVFALAQPTATVSRDSVADGRRHLSVRLAAAEAGAMLRIQLQTTVPIEAAWLDGIPFDLSGYTPAETGQLRFSYAATPSGGTVLSLRLAGVAPVDLELVELRNGLPPPVANAYQRPPTTMASPLGADATVVGLDLNLTQNR